MRPASAAASACLHQTALYGSEEEYLATVVPFVREGAEADYPVVVATASADNYHLLRQAISADEAIFLEPGYYKRPAAVVAGLLELLEQHSRDGTEQIRVVGEVPRPVNGRTWEPWIRYEAAANQLYADYPLRALCPYDTRYTPSAVLDDLRRTHPYRLDAQGNQKVLPDFQDHESFLEGRRLTAPPTEPDVEIVEPTLAQARSAVDAAGRSTRLRTDAVDELALAVNETLTNAMVHGRGPQHLRLWTRPESMVATVTDTGTGPQAVLAGLVPPDIAPTGGRGLWIVNQLCDEVTMGRSDEGFTIRMLMGESSTDTA